MARRTSAEALRRISSWAQARGLDFRHEAETGFGAVFSPCGTWRYLLWRLPKPRAGAIGMGLLNPSTADEHRDDPTIARCRRIATGEGSANLLIWNLFALRATDPAQLRRADDPVGPDNDAAITLALMLCQRTIVAWGHHGVLLGRDQAVLTHCLLVKARLSTLGLTASGAPRHPLYLSREVRPLPWRPRSSGRSP